MEVSVDGGTPKSSNLVGFSAINDPFLGIPIYGNPRMLIVDLMFELSCASEILDSSLPLPTVSEY